MTTKKMTAKTTTHPRFTDPEQMNEWERKITSHNKMQENEEQIHTHKPMNDSPASDKQF